MTRKIAHSVSLALLLVSGCLGLYNGTAEWGDAETRFQKSVMVGVFAYGIFGFLTLDAVLRHKRWAVYSAVIWGMAITYVPGAAAMAYAGDDAILSSAIAASVGSALVSAVIVWSVQTSTRAARSE